MTAVPDPDDLASALLDGQLTAAEEAAARRDPTVMARVVALGAARSALRMPPPPLDVATREAGVAAALAAFDARAAQAEANVGADEHPDQAGALGPVRLGSTAHRRQEAGRRRRWRWLAAAAALLAVVGIGVAAASLGTADHDGGEAARPAETLSDAASDQATRVDEGSRGSEAARDDDHASTAEAPGAASAGPTAGSADLGSVDLGSVVSEDELADRVRATLSGTRSNDASPGDGAGDAAAPGTEAAAPSPSCGDDPPAVAAPGNVTLLRGSALLDGQAVDVWVVQTEGPAASPTLLAVDSGCRLVIDRPLGS